jgi:hypothetical protein
LLPIIAYILPKDDKTPLSKLPELMNNPVNPLKFGFEAALVPEPPADPAARDSWVGNIPIRYFFPWAPIRPDERSVATPWERFRDIIPNVDVGDLYDDISNFGENPGDDRLFQNAFVEIEQLPRDDGVVAVKVVRRGFLDRKEPDQARILDHIEAFQGSRTAVHSTDPNLPRVPLVDISRVFCERAVAEGLAWHPVPVDPEWLRQFMAFLRKIHGRFAVKEMRPIWRMGRYGFAMNNTERFFEMVKQAREDLLTPAATE